jgi:RNA polymerase sigma-54 factor
MVLKQSLDQRQVQKLILAPALQQAIKLLPLTNLELIEIIDTEISQNPLLEVEEEVAEKETEKESKEDKEEERLEESASEAGNDEDDLDFESYFQEYIDDGFRSFFFERKEAPPLENVVSKSPSLWDHLNWQANLTFFDKEDKKIAQYIIGNINEDGYLTVTVDEVAKAVGNPRERVEEVREKIKRFDPVGIAGLSLRECLLTQMEYLQVEDDITRRIINHHLHLLEKSDYAQLAKVLDIPLSAIKYHIEVIKRLDPAPGRKYAQEKTSYAIPDIIVNKEEGELKITLNDEGLPHLKINSYYKRLLAKASKENPDARKFLKDKMKKALWFLRSLDQRNKTINKVAHFIVDKQKDFIEKGIEYIKPLTLMELAQEIGVHESTAGRVVANKYIMTPRGMFPLKYFFHKSISGDYGEEISSLRIKARIKKLVENEERDNPLSDIEMEEILAKENFKIARRTVAKYRKQLKIPPSHIRKRRYLMEKSQ